MLEFLSKLLGKPFDANNIDKAHPDTLTEISVSLLSLGASTLLAALGTLTVALFAWLFVTRHQQRTQEASRRIERLRLLHELEESFLVIAQTRAAYLSPANSHKFNSEDSWCPLITVMTRSFPWSYIPAEYGTEREYVWLDGERMKKFSASGDDFINVTALHEVVFWFRRIYRAKEEGIVTKKDLYNMWRQCLPFMVDGRLSFLNDTFGTTHEDGKNKNFL